MIFRRRLYIYAFFLCILFIFLLSFHRLAPRGSVAHTQRENCLKWCYVFLIRCHAAGDCNDQVNHDNNCDNDNYEKIFHIFFSFQLENALVFCLNLKWERRNWADRERESGKVWKRERSREWVNILCTCCVGQKRIGSFGKYVNKIWWLKADVCLTKIYAIYMQLCTIYLMSI